MSKPTVQTRKGNASVNAMGSRGMSNDRHRGRVKRKEMMADEKMPVDSQKFEPNAREDRNSLKKVTCIRM